MRSGQSGSVSCCNLRRRKNLNARDYLMKLYQVVLRCSWSAARRADDPSAVARSADHPQSGSRHEHRGSGRAAQTDHHCAQVGHPGVEPASDRHPCENNARHDGCFSKCHLRLSFAKFDLDPSSFNTTLQGTVNVNLVTCSGAVRMTWFSIRSFCSLLFRAPALKTKGLGPDSQSGQ